MFFRLSQILLASAVFATGTALATPITKILTRDEAVHLLESHGAAVDAALNGAGITEKSPIGGIQTQFGDPEIYIDETTVSLATCGASPTLPCRVRGCVKISELHQGVAVTVRVEASKSCQF